MTSYACLTRLAPIFAILLTALSPSLLAQGSVVLNLPAPERLSIKRGATGEVKLKAELRPGYHVNSDKPTDEYLIPLKLTWATEPLQTVQIAYPKPQLEKYSFSPTPLAVYSGSFEITTLFKAPANAKSGPATVTGKLRYQACNNKECLPPRSADVTLNVDVQ
jgi:thioredoxin:protein disulfide reductase